MDWLIYKIELIYTMANNLLTQLDYNNELTDIGSHNVIFLGEKKNEKRYFDIEIVQLYDLVRKEGLTSQLLVQDSEKVRQRDFRSAEYVIWVILEKLAILGTL